MAIIKYCIIFVGLLSIQLLFTNAINVNSIYVFAQDAITHLHPIAAEILKIKANIPNPSQFSFVVDNVNQNLDNTTPMLSNTTSLGLNNTTPMLSNTTSLGLNNTTPMLSNTTSLGLNNTVPIVSSTAPNVNSELTPAAFVPTDSETSHISNSKKVNNHDSSSEDKDTHSAKDKDTHSAKDKSVQAIHHSSPSKDVKKSSSDSETSHISNSKNVNHHSSPSKDVKKSSNEDNDEGEDSHFVNTLFY